MSQNERSKKYAVGFVGTKNAYFSKIKMVTTFFITLKHKHTDN